MPKGKRELRRVNWITRLLSPSKESCYCHWVTKWSEVKSLSRVRLFATPWTVACQAPLSMGFSRQEYWSGWKCPSPGDLRNPGIKPRSFYCLSPEGKERCMGRCLYMGRCKHLGLLKLLFAVHLIWVSRASILFPSVLNPLRVCSPRWIMASTSFVYW